MSACSMTFCFITSLLSPMCVTHSFIHLLHASQLFMHYLPTISFCFSFCMRYLFYCEHFCYMLCNCCVHFRDYVRILACFYYVCCIVLKSLQHCFKHILWICVCYGIWFVICYYVQTYSINQRSCMMVTNWNGWCIVLVFASYQHYFCVVKKGSCVQCVQTKHKKIRNINGTKLIATSCFKIQENLLAVNLMINALQSI